MDRYASALYALQGNGWSITESICNKLLGAVPLNDAYDTQVRECIHRNTVKLTFIKKTPHLEFKTTNFCAWYNINEQKFTIVPEHLLEKSKDNEFKIIDGTYIWNTANSNIVTHIALGKQICLSDSFLRTYSDINPKVYKVLAISVNPSGTYMAALVQERSIYAGKLSNFIAWYKTDTLEQVGKAYQVATSISPELNKWIHWHTSDATCSVITENIDTYFISTISIFNDQLYTSHSVECPCVPQHFDISPEGNNQLIIGKDKHYDSMFVKFNCNHPTSNNWSKRVADSLNYKSYKWITDTSVQYQYDKGNIRVARYIDCDPIKNSTDESKVRYVIGDYFKLSKNKKFIISDHLYKGLNQTRIFLENGSSHRLLLLDSPGYKHQYVDFIKNDTALIYVSLKNNNLEIHEVNLEKFENIITHCSEDNINEVLEVVDNHNEYFNPHVLSYCAYKLGLSNTIYPENTFYKYSLRLNNGNIHTLKSYELCHLYQESTLFKKILDNSLECDIKNDINNGTYIINDLGINELEFQLFAEVIASSTPMRSSCYYFYCRNFCKNLATATLTQKITKLLQDIDTLNNLCHYFICENDEIKETLKYLCTKRLKAIIKETIFKVEKKLGKDGALLKLSNIIEEVRSWDISAFNHLTPFFGIEDISNIDAIITNYQGTIEYHYSNIINILDPTLFTPSDIISYPFIPTITFTNKLKAAYENQQIPAHIIFQYKFLNEFIYKLFNSDNYDLITGVHSFAALFELILLCDTQESNTTVHERITAWDNYISPIMNNRYKSRQQKSSIKRKLARQDQDAVQGTVLDTDTEQPSTLISRRLKNKYIRTAIIIGTTACLAKLFIKIGQLGYTSQKN